MAIYKIIIEICIMEKFDLADKTKEELIGIALEHEKVENQLRGELDDVNSQVAKLTKKLKRANKTIIGAYIIYIIMCISIVFMMLEK